MGDEYEGRVMGGGSMGLMLWMMVNEGDGGYCCGAPPDKVGTVTRKYHTEKRQKA
jgi:hypothetical protein